MYHVFWRIDGVKPTQGHAALGIIVETANVQSIAQGNFDDDGVFHVTVYFNDTATPAIRQARIQSYQTLLRYRLNSPQLTITEVPPTAS